MDAERAPHGAWRFDRFSLDLDRGALLGPDGAEVPLRPKSLALLRLLVENTGRVVDRDAIMAAVWPDVVVTDESITQCVRDIRKALGDEAQQLLKTVPKRGYLLAAEVTQVQSTAPAPRAERRLSAILAADIVGYSRLIERDEAATLAAIKDLRGTAIDPLLAEHKGRIVKLMGDGAIVEFASVVDAVACAVSIQKAVADRQAKTPPDQRIVFRMGVNLGDVVVDGDDLLGDGVNVAARLEQLCEPGGVLVSGTAFDHLQGRLGLPLEFTGEQQVKNISRPVRAYRVKLDGSAVGRTGHVGGSIPKRAALAAAVVLLAAIAFGSWWLTRVPAPADQAQPDKLTIAVLPLKGRGDDERVQRLAGGLTEDLIIELGSYRAIAVIARGSVLPYKDKDPDPREVGRALGVSYVVVGSVEIDGQQARISIQLIDATTGSQLAAERFDRTLDEALTLRDEVVPLITNSLVNFGGSLGRAVTDAARRKPPASWAAFDHFATGRDVYRRGVTRENMAEARSHFERAVELDPGLARAWTFIAWTHFNDAYNGWGESVARSWELGHEAARRAVLADGADGWVQSVAGVSLVRQRQYEAGAKAWERALQLAPNEYGVLRDVGCDMARALGTQRAAEGLELVRRSLELNPNRPISHLNCLGFTSYLAGQWAEAVDALQQANDPVLDNEVTLALAAAELGRTKETADAVAWVREHEPDFSIEAYIDNDTYQPGGSSAAMVMSSARKAGLPLCASPEVAAKLDPKNRLPDCDKQRTKAASGGTGSATARQG